MIPLTNNLTLWGPSARVTSCPAIDFLSGHGFLWVVGHMGARMQHAWRMQHMHSEHDDTSAVGGGAVGPVRPCVWGRDTAAVGRAVLAGARVRRRPVHEERSEREE